jgi:hypothetical protein
MAEVNAKTIITGYLGLDPKLDRFWDIIDVYPKEQPRLCLVHYNDEMDPNNREHGPLLQLRGMIIDIVTGAVVSKAFGYNHTLTCDGPIQEDENNILVPTEIKEYFSDYSDNPSENPKFKHGLRPFPKERSAIFLGGESIVVRFFKWDNKVFFSTYRKIEGEKSAWGGRALFSETFRRLMPGFDQEMLFGPEPFSPYTFVFLISDYGTRIITSISENRVLFLALMKTWEETEYPMYTQFSIPLQSLPVPRDPEPDVFSGQVDKPMRTQITITVDLANKFLFPRQFATPVPPGVNAKDYELIPQYSQTSQEIVDIYFKDPGYDSNDERLTGGDMIMIYTMDASGLTQLYRIDSPSVGYRAMVTGNDPVPYHQFVITMPTFSKGNPDELSQIYPRYTFNGTNLNLTKAEERRKWWWSIFYDAVSPDFKDEADNYLTRYKKDLERVANFILKETNTLSDDEKRMVNDKSRQRFGQLLETARTGKFGPFPALMDLLYKETGDSMYKMITTVRNIDRARVRAKAVQLPQAPAEVAGVRISFGQ